MNAHTRTFGTDVVEPEKLLELQLDDFNKKSNNFEPSGPPGYLDVEVETTGFSDFDATSPHDLPFLNLDPYDLEGKDDLPEFTISSPDPDYINWELGGTPDQLEHDLGVFNANLRSDDARIHLEGLSETRVTEVQYGNFNGQKVAIEWQNGISHEASGSIDYLNQGSVWLKSAVEIHESVQAERFTFENGEMSQGLSAYDWGMGMTLDGMAPSYGIDTFEFEFAINISIQWDAELGVYYSEVSVEAVYMIEMLDGRVFEGEAFQEDMGFWSDLDNFNFEFNDDILDKVSNFQRDMGGAWDAVQSFDDHMQALLLKLKDDGYYDLYDNMGGGIENPFDFDLPNVDPFT
ncbi:hypothetical protein LP7551_00154 [Roseibium album]|nr:hypothetical protein LP7551_00154 [Roseibium album]